MMLGNFAVADLAGLDQAHVAFGAEAGLISNHVGVCRHGARVEFRWHPFHRGGRMVCPWGSGRFRLRLGHDGNEGHAAAGAFAGFILVNVAVLRHGAGVILDAPAGLDFGQGLFCHWHEGHAAQGAFTGVVVFEGDVVGPRIMGRAVGIHPATGLIALVAGTELFGIWGALFAAPLAGLLQSILVAAWIEFRGGDAQEVLQAATSEAAERADERAGVA